jgi:hypothetical protein
LFPLIVSISSNAMEPTTTISWADWFI